MRILRYKGKLVEEVAHATDKVVFLKYLKEEDKEKCPHCNKPIDTEISLVENSPNFEESIEGVETIAKKTKG